jgi:hypothetical protein
MDDRWHAFRRAADADEAQFVESLIDGLLLAGWETDALPAG